MGWLVLSGVAHVREWFDEKSGRFRIDVSVANTALGPLFGYRGAFTVEWRDVSSSGVPAHVLPRRVEPRE